MWYRIVAGAILGMVVGGHFFGPVGVVAGLILGVAIVGVTFWLAKEVEPRRY